MELQQHLHDITRLRDAGQHAQALAALRPLLERYPRDIVVQRLGGELFEATGDHAAAAACFHAMLAIRPGAIAALTGLGRLARQAQNWDEMLTWFERASTVDSHHVNSYWQRADALLKLGRPTDAEQVLSGALAQHPDNAELSRRLLQLLFAREDFARAEALTRLLVQQQRDNEWLWRQHLRALRGQNRQKDLLQACEHALQALPQAPALLAEYVGLLHLFGRYEAAQDQARRLQQYIGDNPMALRAWCQLQLNLGQAQKVGAALSHIDSAGNREMELAIQLFRARAAHAQGQYAAALPFLHRLLELKPDHAEGRALLAETHFFLFDIDTVRTVPVDDWLMNQSRNDARLFPGAVAAMQRIAADNSTHQQLALAGAAIVHDAPQCGSTTLYWLRHLGFAADLFASVDSSEIPRRVLQYWHGPLPQDVADSMASWHHDRTFSAYHLFDAEQAGARLRAYAPALDQATFLQLNARVQADLLRWVVLYEEGGLWVNADCVRRRSLSPGLFEGRNLLLMQNRLGYLDTGIVAAAPGHPLLRLTLDYALEAALAQPEMAHALTSGHAALAMACATLWGEELLRSGRIAGAALLPQSQFKTSVSLAVPHDYHRLAHIPAEILARLTVDAA